MKREICHFCKKPYFWNDRKNPERIRKYCSRECANKARIGIKFPEEWRTKMSEARLKEWANGKRIGHSGWHHSDKSRLKIGESNKLALKGNIPWNKGKKLPQFSGKNHPNWKGNKRKKRQQRNDSLYQYWVKMVRKRDKNTCRVNDKNCTGYLEVHHILSWSTHPELRYNINNGITLCQAHHPRKRAEEKQLISVFQKLVKVSNSII